MIVEITSIYGVLIVLIVLAFMFPKRTKKLLNTKFLKTVRKWLSGK